MNSFLKGVLHAVASAVAVALPYAVLHSPMLQESVATLLTVALNWVISHTIPTTTGASAVQAATGTTTQA